ncbi:MAG: endospore germination permease [Clostridia bacterium]|nr:endospore germination permease [Clostridia bacterium]
MIKDNDRISAGQARTFIILTIVGVGVLSLPRIASERAQSDAWLIVIIGGVIALSVSFLIIKLGERFPGDTVVEYSQKIVGKFIGTVMSIYISIYFALFCSFIIRIFGEVLKMYLLPWTPIEVTMFALLIMSVYICRSGLEAIARLDKVIFPIFIAISALFLFSIPDMDLSNLLPVFTTSPVQILRGSLDSAFAFLGIETLLLIFPFIDTKQSIEKTVFNSLLMVILFYLYIVVISIARLGVSGSQSYIWPLMTVAKSIDIPGVFIERIEGVIMGLWVFIAFTSLITLHFTSSLTLSKIFKTTEQKGFIVLLVPFIYSIALLPDSIAEVYDYAGFFSKYLGVTASVFIPLFLFLVSLVRGKGGQNAV